MPSGKKSRRVRNGLDCISALPARHRRACENRLHNDAVSELPVSAGLGAFLEGEMFQQIQVPASSVPAGTEFGIYVSGDSMEPRYHDGQIVWVKRCEELECGDIGIFVYDDCGYLKKYDEHTPDKSQAEFLTDSYGVVHNQPVLVSLNTKYSPILISPEQRFEVVGKVLN